MNPTIRLVATDIDGTLADPVGRLTDRTLQVLNAVHDAGIAVTLVTGLNPWVARRYADTIGPWAHAICLNGIFRLNQGRTLPGMYLDPATAREAVALILDQGFIPLVYGDDQVSRYLPRRAEGMGEVAKLIDERPFQPYVPVDTPEALFAVRPAQVSVCDTGQRGERLHPQLAEALGSRAYVILQPGARTWVEVNHLDARKDRSLLALAESLDIAPDEIVYFGDSLNDLPVFENLPYAVAMGNARPEVKRLAWKTTTSNAEDGVATFLAQHFRLDLG
ncbi:MAG: Cof-type HAD-IIB family hydrolase [Anaerolineae bacterium]|nr:Cof-type HAD-IIB family hydrolase [Anaerolineae bacterium]